MMRPIEKMSILVTGGGSGIGAGIARFYAEHGAKVTICGRRADKITEVARALGPNCRGEAADVTKDADRRRIVAAAVEHGGGLDALVFTGGIGEHHPAVRAGICAAAAWLGVEIDAPANASAGPRISGPASRVTAWVVAADEEQVIAQHTVHTLKLH